MRARSTHSRAGGTDGPASGDGTARVVEKAVDVLFCLASASGDLGVTELARQLGLGKSTVHRLLATLQRRDLVLADPRTHRYRLGFGVLTLGSALLRQLDIRAAALPHLRRLRDETGETASLTVRRGTLRIHLESVESLADLKFSLEVGKPLPTLVGASGKVLTAWLPEPELEALVEACGLPALTPQSITNREDYVRELATVRADGFAVSDSERFPGVVSVAAPVRDHRGEVVAAVNVTGPGSRLTAGHARGFGPLVAAGARQLSADLGWRPPAERPTQVE
jgi:DNA-binding IclR family transcriptional regulator